MDSSREQAIVCLLEQYGHMSIGDLSGNLFISSSTVRRMLAKLEREGIVCRSHGGVSLASNGLPKSMQLRDESMRKEKRMIAEAAAELVAEDSLIFLDTSTTVKHIIEFLRKKRNITVITNSLPALMVLDTYGISAKCTGGDLENGSSGFVGHHAEKYLSHVYADFAFFSTPCISKEGRISDHSEQETFIRQIMIANAKKSAFLFDHTKYERNGPYTVCRIEDIDYLISDMDLSHSFMDREGNEFPICCNGIQDSMCVAKVQKED